MSERVALIGRIKRARAEIGQMRNRERSAVRATENISHRTLTDAEIRNAIIAEIESLPQSVSQFYEDTMETEREYQTELRHDLEDIDRAIRQAETNSNSVLELLRRQDAIAVQTDRIGGLKLELDDLRSQLV
jgi:type II secretory pathway predicted ATPase ExeA